MNMRSLLRPLGLVMLLLFWVAVPVRAAAPLSVTLLLEHSPDSDWNRLLCKGLERAASEFGLDVRIRYVAPGEDARAVFAEAARQAMPSQAKSESKGGSGEAGLVLVASQGLHEALRDNAGNYRRAMFGCIDAAFRAPNVMCVTFADEEGAYLAGVAAAMRSRSKVVGWLSGEDVPAMRSLFNGFAEGAHLVSPSLRVIQGLAGSFVDAAAAGAEARRLIAAGVDVLGLAAGAANSGALAEARAAGIEVVGLDVDQSRAYPGHVLTSVEKRADEALYSIVAATAKGDFRGKEVLTWGLSGGVSVTDPAQSLGQNNAQIQDIRRRLDEVEREIAGGGIRIKSLRDRTLCDCR